MVTSPLMVMVPPMSPILPTQSSQPQAASWVTVMVGLVAAPVQLRIMDGEYTLTIIPVTVTLLD